MGDTINTALGITPPGMHDINIQVTKTGLAFLAQGIVSEQILTDSDGTKLDITTKTSALSHPKDASSYEVYLIEPKGAKKPVPPEAALNVLKKVNSLPTYFDLHDFDQRFCDAVHRSDKSLSQIVREEEGNLNKHLPDHSQKNKKQL